jgi:hypothetical protein
LASEDEYVYEEKYFAAQKKKENYKLEAHFVIKYIFNIH